MNRRANIVIRTPFGNTESFTIDSLVKQGTSLGPIQVCAYCYSYQYGTVKIKTLEFVDDIADANNGSPQALHSHKIITDIIKSFPLISVNCLKSMAEAQVGAHS